MTYAKIQGAASSYISLLYVAFSLGFCCITCMPAVANGQLLQKLPPPKTVNFDDGHGITKAMKAGDVASLRLILKSDLAPLTRGYANAAYYRTLFDLKRSSLYARRCFDGGLKGNGARPNPVMATLCGELLAGNYNIQGNISGWASAALETKIKVTPIIRSAVGATRFEIAGLNNHDFGKFTHFPKNYASSYRQEVVLQRFTPRNYFSRRLPISAKNHHRYDDSPIPYIVRVKINGKEREMALDSGSSISILRAHVAKRLGIALNPSPYLLHLDWAARNPRPPGQVAKPGRQAHLGLVKEMTLGGMGKAIHLQNVPVAVGGHIDMLGMNVLSKMTSILLTRRHLVLNAVSRPNSCDEPLQIASSPMGGYGLVFRYPVDGIMRNIMLDTGSSSYLAGTSSTPATAVPNSYSTSNRYDIVGLLKARYFEQPTVLGKGRFAHHLKMRVYPDYHAPYGYVLGMAALRDFNVYVNFKRRVACLVPLSRNH
ncbi:MAG: retropepsin-like aspartic protease [Spirochaetales bacterium]|jgi:hypothetical protein|nr:retropepsin-like aspartic protease [Spirochaetales bacterium]